MSQQWFYARGGERQGPVTAAQLQRLAASGQIGRADLVWCKGMPQWVQATTVMGLFPAASSTSSPQMVSPSAPTKMSSTNTPAQPTPGSPSSKWVDKKHPASRIAGGVLSVVLALLVLLGLCVRTYLRFTGKSHPGPRNRSSISQKAPIPQQMERLQANQNLAAYKEYMDTFQHFFTQAAEIDAIENVIASKSESNEPYGDVLTTLIVANEAAKKDADVLAAFCDRALLGRLSPDAREGISTFRGVLLALQSGLAAQHGRLRQIQSQLNSSTPDASAINANWESYIAIGEEMGKALGSLE